MPEQSKKKISGKVIFNCLTAALSVGLLAYFCLSDNGLLTLVKSSQNFQGGWLAAGLGCTFTDLFLDMMLTFLFTKSVSDTYTVGRAFKVCMVGHLYSAITPFQSGGQPMQIYVMSKQKIDPGAATSMMVQKFFVYQMGITIYSLLAILYQTLFAHIPLSSAMWGLAMVGFAVQAGAAVILLVFSFNQSLTHWMLTHGAKLLAKLHIVKDPEQTVAKWQVQIDVFHQSNQQLYKNKKLLVFVSILTFLQLTALFAASYCVYRAFGFCSASLVSMIFSQAFVTMVSSLVPLPGAAGASEGSFYVFFASYFTPQTLKSAILLWRIITYYAVILVSAPFSHIREKM